MTEILDSDGYGNLLDSDGNILYIYESDGMYMYDSDGLLVLAPVQDSDLGVYDPVGISQDSDYTVVPADSADYSDFTAEWPKTYFAHRGNLYGPNPELENTIAHIDSAIGQGFHVEVDVWNINGTMVLGHDKPSDSDILSNYVHDNFFVNRSNRLLVHCKNGEALCHMMSLTSKHGPAFEFFFHDSDAYTITSYQSIIAYPDKPCPLHVDETPMTIAMMPERHNTDTTDFKAICTDYPVRYRDTSS